jgi:hypothetical protein
MAGLVQGADRRHFSHLESSCHGHLLSGLPERRTCKTAPLQWPVLTRSEVAGSTRSVTGLGRIRSRLVPAAGAGPPRGSERLLTPSRWSLLRAAGGRTSAPNRNLLKCRGRSHLRAFGSLRFGADLPFGRGDSWRRACLVRPGNNYNFGEEMELRSNPWRVAVSRRSGLASTLVRGRSLLRH